MADTTRLDHRCRNCGADAPLQYCPTCGQETRVALPTVREIMRDATGRLVSLDSRLWRTLLALVLRPGVLTTEYLHGRRKRYVRPARLFFVTAIVLFAAIRLVVPPMEIVTLDLNVQKTVPADALAAPSAPPPPAVGGAARTATVSVDPDIDEALTRFRRWLPRDWVDRVERFQLLSKQEQTEQIYSGLMRYAPYGMVALLPAFALLLYLAYLPGRRRHPQRPSRYVEHLVYGAYLHAFAFIMLTAIVLSPFAFLRWALAAWILIYAIRSRQRVYGGGWLSGLVRLMPVAVAYLGLLALVMTALLALSVATR